MHVRRLALVAAFLSFGLLWPAPTAAAPSGPLTGPVPNNTCLIYSLYLVVLHRQADAPGLTAGLAYLGSHTTGEYGLTLLTGDEYRTLLIRGWYQSFLGRPPTAGQLDTWLSLLDGGAKDEVIMGNLIGTDEYFTQPRVGGDNVKFITAVYHDVLGRPLDPSGQTFWTTFLAGNTHEAMAQAILAGNEYRTDVVQGAYQKYLGRPADSLELAAGLTIITGGGNDEQVIAVVVGTQEYFALAGLCRLYLPALAR